VIGPWNALSALREVVDLHERTSADVIAVLATSLEGRRLSLPIDGRRLEGLVHWIGVQGSAEPHQIRMQLREVDYDGWRLDPVAIAADEVRMRSSPAANLTAFGLRIDGRAPLRSLIARLDRQLKDWSLAVGPDGRVEARNVRCPELRLTVEPSVRDHRVDLELRGVRWRRVHLNLPRSRGGRPPAIASGWLPPSSAAVDDLVGRRHDEGRLAAPWTGAGGRHSVF
jgi:hypothetical protein